MEIRKSKNYHKDYQKKILGLHKAQEMEKIAEIEELLIHSANMKELMQNPLRFVYGIEQKKGTLKEYFTGNINNKLRLLMKPIGEYPYQLIEIESISFEKIDDKHYGDG